MLLAQNDDVIEALSPDRSDHAFSERILPGRLRRNRNIFDLQRSHLPLKRVSEIGVSSIPQDWSNWRAVQTAVGCSVTFICRNRRTCDAGPRRLIMCLATVVSQTTIPSLSTSPRIRGALQSGLARH